MKKILLILSLVLIGMPSAQAVTLISDVFNVIGPSEEVIAEFAVPGSGTTINQYRNYVELYVSGVGHAEPSVMNDAFYFLNGTSTECCVGNRGLNISFTGDARELEADGIRVATYMAFLAGPGFVSPGVQPGYNALSHEYNFVLDIGDTFRTLTLGTGDGGVFDNSGQFDIRVTQLALKTVIPEPSTLFLLGFGLMGAVFVKRKS